jgi:MerR family transcriptional regulator, light-induced transcriptional regulator
VRMVADFFEIDGWNTFYLGSNTPHESVIATVVQRGADVLAVSATISYHVEAVRDLITAVHQHPAAGGVKILAGGYPFNLDPDVWRKVGADGSASDAQQAIALANQLV